MKLRTLGAGAPAVPAVGYGGMHLSLQERPPEQVSIEVIHAALDAGVRLIDTADVYCLDDSDLGHNERLVADALRRLERPAKRSPGRDQGRRHPARRPLGA